MKPFHISIFFLLIINGLVGRQAIGQTFGQPFYCVNYATNTSGAAVQITFSLPQALGTISSIAPSGPNELLVATAASINNTASPRTATISVRCAANNRCPGKVRVNYGTGTCLLSVEVTVYKSYTQSNINAFSAFVFGFDDNSIPKPYQIISDGCADPGELLNLSVVPVVSTIPCTTASDIYTWRFVDGSGNPLAGWSPLFASSDNSAIALRVPSPFTQPCTVQVRVGTCAAANVVHAQLIIRPNASPQDIRFVASSAGEPIAPNISNVAAATNFSGVMGDRSWCLNADYGTGAPNYTSDQFTLEAWPDESSSGVTYDWTIPNIGFALVSQTGNKITVRALRGINGTSGVFTVAARSPSSCRAEYARFNITRRLVSPFNDPSIAPSAGTPAPTACNPAVNPIPLEVKQDYVITIPNVPANTPITWSCANPGTQPYWEFRPAGSSKANTVYQSSIAITTGNSVIARYRIPVGYTGTLSNPTINITGGTCNATLQYNPLIKLPGSIRLSINISGSNGNQNNNLTVVNTSGAPAWPLASACSQNNIRYQWSFQGLYQCVGCSSATDFNLTEYEGTQIFNVNNVLGQNVTNLAPGIYNGIFRVAVHNGAAACGNCFGAEASLPFVQTVNRPPGGGGTGDVQDALPTMPQLYLKPNPAVGTGTAGKEMFKK